MSDQGARSALIADDDRLVREMLAESLKRHGFDSTPVEDGASAFRALTGTRFDLAFIDLHMPGIDGVELLRLLRARGDTGRFIVVSGSQDMRLVVSAVKLGASDYLPKPFSDEDVAAALARVYGAAPDPTETAQAMGPAGSPAERRPSSTEPT
jgi:CheY-like chemotaxis protein